MVFCSLLAEVFHGQRKMRERRETSAEIRRVSRRASTSVSLTTSDILVTCSMTLANRFARERAAAGQNTWRAPTLNSGDLKGKICRLLERTPDFQREPSVKSLKSAFGALNF